MQCNHCGSTHITKNGLYKTKSGSIKQRYKCNYCGVNQTSIESPDIDKVIDEISDVEVNSQLTTKTKYVITSCQSNTKTNSKFLDSLIQYCDINDAKLLIIPIKYRNPRVSENEEVHEFDQDLEEYLLDDNIKIHHRLKVLGKLKINATASNPLSGLDPICKGDSIIVGHNQLQLKTIAVAQDDFPVIMTTTGTVSEPKFSESKSGYKAEFNHSYSAIVVELDHEFYHLRQIEFDGNGFQDLDIYYSSYTCIGGRTIEALIPGDEHVRFSSPEVYDATYYSDDSILNILNPKYIVRHDLLDCYSVSHHHNKNVFTKYAKHIANSNSIRDELDMTINYVFETSYQETKNVIISSNHNDHLLRWLNECDPKLEPWNALIYHELMYKMLNETSMSQDGASYPNPFELYSDDVFTSKDYNVQFISRNESFKILDIECAFHGDVGANGSRGSRNQFSNLPSKTVIGHSHSPGIQLGCYQTGTSSILRMEYNIGPSSWLQTHCIIYPNGKRTLINIINGRWRA